MLNIHLSNMTREYTISEGSGDAIALAVFRDTNGLKVAIGSLCDENTQYNMPGNLRVWDADTKNCSTLKGHYIRNEENGPGTTYHKSKNNNRGTKFYAFFLCRNLENRYRC